MPAVMATFLLKSRMNCWHLLRNKCTRCTNMYAQIVADFLTANYFHTGLCGIGLTRLTLHTSSFAFSQLYRGFLPHHIQLKNQYFTKSFCLFDHNNQVNMVRTDLWKSDWQLRFGLVRQRLDVRLYYNNCKTSTNPPSFIFLQQSINYISNWVFSQFPTPFYSRIE